MRQLESKDPGEGATSRGVTNPNVSEVDVVEPTPTKVCCRCRELLPFANFYKRSVAADGLGHSCKACLAEGRRARRGMTPEDRAAELAELQTRPTKTCSACGVEKGRAEFRSKKASRDGMTPKCRLCESEWHRQHYEKTRDRRLVQTAEWFAANRDRKNATSRAYAQANKERLDVARRAWLEAHPGFMAEFMRRRRAMMRGVRVEQVDIDALWTGSCGICGEPMDRSLKHPDPLSKSVDHIHPVSRGGAHAADNLQWAHLICNIRKGAKVPD